MAAIVLGGRTFSVRALTVGDALDVYALGLPESEVSIAMLCRALAPEDGGAAATPSWVRSLPITEMGQIISLLTETRREAGMTRTTGGTPGEASSPATP